MPDKIQIVLDADVIIHFSQGGYLHLLPKVIPECAFVVLSVVKAELRQDTKNELDNHITFLKNITLIEYNPEGWPYDKRRSIWICCKGEKCRQHFAG